MAEAKWLMKKHKPVPFTPFRNTLNGRPSHSWRPCRVNWDHFAILVHLNVSLCPILPSSLPFTFQPPTHFPSPPKPCLNLPISEVCFQGIQFKREYEVEYNQCLNWGGGKAGVRFDSFLCIIIIPPHMWTLSDPPSVRPYLSFCITSLSQSPVTTDKGSDQNWCSPTAPHWSMRNIPNKKVSAAWYSSPNISWHWQSTIIFLLLALQSLPDSSEMQSSVQVMVTWSSKASTSLFSLLEVPPFWPFYLYPYVGVYGSCWPMEKGTGKAAG